MRWQAYKVYNSEDFVIKQNGRFAYFENGLLNLQNHKMFTILDFVSLHARCKLLVGISTKKVEKELITLQSVKQFYL